MGGLLWVNGINLDSKLRVFLWIFGDRVVRISSYFFGIFMIFFSVNILGLNWKKENIFTCVREWFRYLSSDKGGIGGF